MKVNETPKLDQLHNETNCCPPFHPEEWDDKEFVFEDKLFVKGITNSFMYMPLNMASMMKKTWGQAEKAGAGDDSEFIMLSNDVSPWKAEHFLSVTKEVPGADNVKLSGTFVTKVFEGPYKDMKDWVKEMEEFIDSKNLELMKLYFYYTTCPKCAKHYGKNYVVGFAQIA